MPSHEPSIEKNAVLKNPEQTMYIGVGTIVLIIIVVVLVKLVMGRRS